MDKWIAEMIAKMHIFKVKQKDVAERIGITREAVNRTLNGKIKAQKSRDRIARAISEIIAERS